MDDKKETGNIKFPCYNKEHTRQIGECEDCEYADCSNCDYAYRD